MSDRKEYFRQYQKDSYYRMFMRCVDMFEDIEQGLMPEQQYELKEEPEEVITFEL
ncbi:hypothetical protein [Brucella sp. CMUL 015]|uniref:hypothetical protein n=1 Tax=Brucella sp. CMUL 015 TaxID=1905697 RepID=UPI001300F838|nr:hypothetical protein [Brucella sp. CMUL 015]